MKKRAASDQKREASSLPGLYSQKKGNAIPPGINILMKKPRDLYFVAFLGFLYPILNIGFGQWLKPHSYLILPFVKS